MLAQLGCRHDRASTRRGGGGLFECCGNVGVRPYRREREMTSAADRVVDDLREEPVTAPPVSRRPFPVERRCQQRVREADRPVSVLDQVSGKGGLERVVGGACRAEQGRRRTANGRNEQQRVASSLGETTEPAAHETLQALRDRKRLCRICSGPLGLERTAELERVEGIATRGLVKAQQRRARKRSP